MNPWLVPENRRDLTPDRYHSGYKSYKIKPIEAIVYHYTAGLNPRTSRRWLTLDDSTYVSAHFLVERSGDLWQLAPLTDRCFHAGGMSSKLFGKPNVNGRTIGIEIDNVGPLIPQDGGFVTLSGKPFTGPGASYQWGDYLHWEAYTPEAIDTVVELTKKLIVEFPEVGADLNTRLVGHVDVDPSRKIDPGPLFPWEILRERVR